MKTLNEAREFFSKETLFEAVAVVRTTAFRFIVRAKNIATNEESIFFLDLQLETLHKNETA